MSNTDAFLTIPIGAGQRQFWVSRHRVRNYIVSEIIRGNIRDRSGNVIRQVLQRYNLPRAYNTQISGIIRRAQQLNNCAVQFNPAATPPRERGMRRDENNRAHPELRPRPDTPTNVLPLGDQGGDGMDVDNRSRTPSSFDRDRQFTPSPRPRAPSPRPRTPSPYRERGNTSHHHHVEVVAARVRRVIGAAARFHRCARGRRVQQHSSSRFNAQKNANHCRISLFAAYQQS